VSPYAASKLACEALGHVYHHLYKMDVAMLRFFTVYGPRQRPEMAITLFARAVVARRPIPMFGDGSMRRDFTHVDDIVRGILATLDLDGPPGFRAYNLGSGSPVDLHQLVAAIGSAAGITPQVQSAPEQLGDVQATFADIARAREELHWEPRVTLAEGLATVLAWVTSARE
jgi:UDP-glucuronate 4-epimerase